MDTLMSTVFTKETKLQRATHLCFDNYFKIELSEKEMAHETLKLQIATLKEVQEEEMFKGGDTNSDDGDSVQATMTMLYYDEGR
jgi:hypothetical protein